MSQMAGPKVGTKPCHAISRYLLRLFRRRCRCLEEGRVLPVTLGLELGRWNEAHRRGVHAVTKSGRARSIVEEVAEVRGGVRGADLGALVAENAVALGANVRRVERPCKAGPAGPRVVLV